MEWLMTYSPTGQPLGLRERQEVHTLGLWHRVIHLWVVSGAGETRRVWFQQRSVDTQEYPGWYELASSGHIDGEEEPLSAVLRETQEELGLTLDGAALTFLGETWEDGRWQERIDREWCSVFLYACDEVPAFQPGEEVQRMVAMTVEETRRREKGLCDRVTAQDEKDEPLLLPASCWCPHPGEFEHLVLPALQD